MIFRWTLPSLFIVLCSSAFAEYRRPANFDMPHMQDYLGYYEAFGENGDGSNFDGADCTKDGRGGNDIDKIQISAKQFTFINERRNSVQSCRFSKILDDDQDHGGTSNAVIMKCNGYTLDEVWHLYATLKTTMLVRVDRKKLTAEVYYKCSK